MLKIADPKKSWISDVWYTYTRKNVITICFETSVLSDITKGMHCVQTLAIEFRANMLNVRNLVFNGAPQGLKHTLHGIQEVRLCGTGLQVVFSRRSSL